MTRRLALFALLSCSLLVSAQRATGTQSLDFPNGGLLRLVNSAGEVQIEGWDRPQVEMTTVKSNPRVKVAAGLKGQEIVVTTTVPRSHWYTPPTQLDLTYIIKVPRAARLAIAHGEGEVHVAEVTGDVRATVRQGLITLSLAPDAHYDIDARSRLGSVVSDFPGDQHHRLWFFNHEFTEHPPAAAQKLYLRIGFGDIILLKTH